MKYKTETATIVFENRIVEVKLVYNQKNLTKKNQHIELTSTDFKIYKPSVVLVKG